MDNGSTMLVDRDKAWTMALHKCLDIDKAWIMPLHMLKNIDKAWNMSLTLTELEGHICPSL